MNTTSEGFMIDPTRKVEFSQPGTRRICTLRIYNRSGNRRSEGAIKMTDPMRMDITTNIPGPNGFGI